MEYVNLGNSGLKVSRLCLGMMSYGDPDWALAPWLLPAEAGKKFVKRALDLGINFFDTADVYSYGQCEGLTGEALCQYARRDEVVIATKVFWGTHPSPRPNQTGLSRKHIMESIDAALRRLGTDHVDLYLIHRWDAETPIEETMEALHDVVRAGKALYIGASSMYAGGALTTAASSRVAYDVKEAIVYGSEGKIEVHAPWYKPTAMTVYRAREAPEVVEMPLGGFIGYEYEALAVIECIRQGKTECDVMPLDDTLAVMETLDRIRQQWRLSPVG